MAGRPGALEGMGLTRGFWAGRRVLLTGHTGFKGSWAAAWLLRLGARVTGVSLAPDSEPSLFALLSPWPDRLVSHIADIRDREAMQRIVDEADPEVVVHMAAQALVPDSYRTPYDTWSTNVMGTLALLEALRGRPGVQAILVVTSDKVYENRETAQAFAENDRLGGDDPYSASKAACEIAVHSWRKSFFPDGPPLATARAGNVIGGGDWAADRLIPDIVRALSRQQVPELRNPDAVRPWQHVMDPVYGYLLYVERLAAGAEVPLTLNFGPSAKAVRTVSAVAEQLCAELAGGQAWKASGPGFPEKHFLHLDASLARKSIGWTPRLDVDAAIDWTAEWYRLWNEGGDARSLVSGQIDRYERLIGE